MVVTVLFDIYERVTKSDTLEINTDNWVDKEPRRVSNGPNICFEVKKNDQGRKNVDWPEKQN